MQNLKQIETITQNFNLLQGMRVVPFGLFILVEAAAYGRLAWYTTWRPLSSAALLAAAIGLSLLAHYYYRQNFGQVRSQREPGSLAQAGLILLGLALMIAAGALDRQYDLPLSLFGLAAAIFLFGALYLPGGALWSYRLLLVLALVVLSLLPLTGLIAAGDLFGPDNVYGSFLVGLGFVFIGISDHLQLARALPAPPEEA